MQACHSRSRSSSITNRKLSITSIDTPSYSINTPHKSGVILNTSPDTVENLENSWKCLHFFKNLVYSKFNNLKEKIKHFKKPVQKILTLTDIITDVRTCYLMYSINPYWYTIMLSAIVTPFIVFWASSYNFKNVVKLSNRADSSDSWENKLLSSWVTALSLPIIGVILTIIEIVGLYLLDLSTPLIKLMKLDRLRIFQFWFWCLNSFKSNNSIEFFTISELFFESIPQVILQLWIYTLYSESFTDSSGNPLLTTFDISLSLGSAILNIIMNGYQIKNKARSWGLSVSSYIPYFMGSQLDIVKDSCIPVKNWLNTNRYSCDLSHIKTFFASKMIKESNKQIEIYLNKIDIVNHLLPQNDADEIYKPKKIIIPLNVCEHVPDIKEVDIKRVDIILLCRSLRKAHEKNKIAIDINQYGGSDNKHSDKLYYINKDIISENRLNCEFLKNWNRFDCHKCCKNSLFACLLQVPFVNKYIICRCRNIYKVPLIEKFLEEIPLKNIIKNKIKLIEDAETYIEEMNCKPNSQHSFEVDIYDKLSDSRKTFDVAVKYCESLDKNFSVDKKKNNSSIKCFKLSQLNNSAKIKEEYLSKIEDNIKLGNHSEPYFYSYIQYIKVITMLFNPSYFYLYQSKTIQFYIILSIYGDRKIISKIYESIQHLRTACYDSNTEIFQDKKTFEEWKSLLYMNNELIAKICQYLSMMIYREKDGSQMINLQETDGNFNYITKIILNSLISNIGIVSYSKYKLIQYPGESYATNVSGHTDPRIKSIAINIIPEAKLMSGVVKKGNPFRMLLQTYFDIEHRFYYITNFAGVLKDDYDNYGITIYKKKETSYLTIENDSRSNTGLSFTDQKTNAVKFIFVKEETDKNDNTELKESNYNKYYILTQCRQYFIQFKYEDKSQYSDSKVTVKPFLISRENHIGSSPTEALVALIDSDLLAPTHEKLLEHHRQINYGELSDIDEETDDDIDEIKINIEQ